MPKTLDPYSIDPRHAKEVNRLLTFMESLNLAEMGMTMPQYLTGMLTIKRIQTLDKALRKENDEPADTGSAVRTYSRAFEQNANRRKSGHAGRAAAALLATTDADDNSD